MFVTEVIDFFFIDSNNFVKCVTLFQLFMCEKNTLHRIRKVVFMNSINHWITSFQPCKSKQNKIKSKTKKETKQNILFPFADEGGFGNCCFLRCCMSG